MKKCIKIAVLTAALLTLTLFLYTQHNIISPNITSPKDSSKTIQDLSGSLETSQKPTPEEKTSVPYIDTFHSGAESAIPSIETEAQNELPEGFIYLNVPGIIIDLHYATENNFTGDVVDGYYTAQNCIVTLQAALALEEIQEKLSENGLSLIIYDSYRPCRAVECFSQWSKNSGNTTKEKYYPNVDKASLFSKGYLAHKSAHSRGSTVDVSLIDSATQTELDMGGHFDLLDPISSHGAKGLTTLQENNRKLLKETMEAGGFIAYSKEWWHYTLKNEPFPDEYFDFDVR